MYHGRCVALAVCILILLTILSELPSNPLPQWKGIHADAKSTGSSALAGVEETQSISGPTIQDFYVNTTQCSAFVQWNFSLTDSYGLQNATFWWNNGTTDMDNTTYTFSSSPLSENALFNNTLPSTSQNVTFQCWAYNTYNWSSTGVRWMLAYPSNSSIPYFLNLGTAIQTVENDNNWGTADPYLSVVLQQNSTSVLNTMIDNYANSHDWYDTLMWSAICYKLGILQQTDIKYALGNITMCYNSTYNAYLPADPHTGGFSPQYGKALLYGYFFNNMTWAHVNDTKWNITSAYIWFNQSEYTSLTSHNPREFVEYFYTTGGYQPSPYNRYYDEDASTIEEYLIFAELLNVSGAVNDALYCWNILNTQLWNSYYGYYNYRTDYTAYECEAGFFLKIISQLDYYVPNLGNWTHVIADIGNRFLSKEWYSAQWGDPISLSSETTAYAVVHAIFHNGYNVNQTRLENTLGAWQTLLGAYPVFNSTYQNDMIDMLAGNNNTRPAWQLLLSSYTHLLDASGATTYPLFNQTSNQFRECSISDSDTFQATDSNATAQGEILIFLMGVVPGTTTIAFPLEELSYEYIQDMDPAIFKMSLTSTLKQITIPITAAGTMTFQYGCSPVTYYFSQSGIWQINFTNSMNNIASCQRLGNLPNNIIYFKSIVSTPTHDIAVVDVTSSKTVIGQGYSTETKVTVANQGTFSETFNVTTYADTAAIDTQQISGLNAMEQTTLIFTWNTSGLAYGNYTLSAYAWPVPNETNTANNNYTKGVITITIPGDLNGDFTVSRADLALLANAYGSEPGDVKWNPNADIDGNGAVDLSDLVILAQHYGQHYPIIPNLSRVLG